MKVLLDTNVWLDIILGREGFLEPSLTALYDCIDEGDDLCIVATSVKDIFFVVERLEGGEYCLWRGRAHTPAHSCDYGGRCGLPECAPLGKTRL